MSSPPGIDYETLLHRLHGGLCEFQNLRAHRRNRHAEVASPVSSVQSPPVATASHGAEAFGEMPLPQGYVTVGGRLVPFFGEVQAPSAPTVPTPSPSPSAPVADLFAPPPPPPAPPPVPTFDARLTPTPPRPVNAAVLNLPPPIPPARLGLVTTPTPAAEGEPAPATASPTKQDEPHDGAAPHHVSTAALEAMLQGLSDAEAERLDRVHAEHRAALAVLLGEHRSQLQDQADAEAARQAEHRTQLGHALETHAHLIRQLLAQHRDEMWELTATADGAARGHASSIARLHQTLGEQAVANRDTQDQATQQISDLTAAIGDLGQTVGLLAVATFDHKRDKSPALASPTFLPPPPRPSSSAASGPTPLPTRSCATSPDSGHVAEPAPVPSPGFSTPIPAPPMPNRDIGSLKPPSESILPGGRGNGASGRVEAFIHELGDDDDLLQGVDDPDNPPPRARLPPITPLEFDDDTRMTNV